MDFFSIIIDSVVISIILYGGIFFMIKINPRAQLYNYLFKIRESVLPKNKEENKILLRIGIQVMILLVAYIIISFYIRFQGSGISYFSVLFRWIIVNGLVCVIDLFIFDYFIFCTITPKFIIIPGTEGNSAYKYYF